MDTHHLYQRSTLSPRRRRARPQWSQEQEQNNSTRQNILSNSSLCFFENEESAATEILPSSLSSTKKDHSLLQISRPSKKRKIFISVLAVMCLIASFMNASVTLTFDSIHSFDNSDGAYLAVRRRLISPGIFAKQKEGNHTKELYFLTFGGPMTYGRGLDRRKRNSQAYPYLLSSPDKVKNVAHFSYDSTSPTMASLCTQSIVESTNVGSTRLENSSTEFNVITLEYPFATADTTKEAYISSMELLIHRLRQRYPQSNIVLVKIWTPSDLVLVEKLSNRKASFEEWKRNQKQQNYRFLNDAPVEWFFRELSQNELEVEDELKAIIMTVGGSVAQLRVPNTLNESLVDNWFIEEPYKTDMETNTGTPTLFRYTLSPAGHAALAQTIQDTLTVKDNIRLSSNTVQPSPYSSSVEPLHSWGSGDSCQIWYGTGLQDVRSYSDGLTPNKIAPDSHVLEVTASKGGQLQVHNPFDTAKLIYLTYLTASDMATSNKVYPKTKIKMVTEAKQNQSSPSASTSVLLDPSHRIIGQHKHHFTRTSAVGLLPALQTGTLEFTTLEEYTIHPFRILGVSILHENNTNIGVPIELSMFSPRRLSVDNGLTDKEFDEDDTEEVESKT